MGFIQYPPSRLGRDFLDDKKFFLLNRVFGSVYFLKIESKRAQIERNESGIPDVVPSFSGKFRKGEKSFVMNLTVT